MRCASCLKARGLISATLIASQQVASDSLFKAPPCTNTYLNRAAETFLDSLRLVQDLLFLTTLAAP